MVVVMVCLLCTFSCGVRVLLLVVLILVAMLWMVFFSFGCGLVFLVVMMILVLLVVVLRVILWLMLWLVLVMNRVLLERDMGVFFFVVMGLWEGF